MSKGSTVPFQPPSSSVFEEEDKKRVELEKSTNILDLLTAFLMTPHTGEPFTEKNDAFGLWYSFARPKAAAILEKFNVTIKGA